LLQKITSKSTIFFGGFGFFLFAVVDEMFNKMSKWYY